MRTWAPTVTNVHAYLSISLICLQSPVADLASSPQHQRPLSSFGPQHPTPGSLPMWPLLRLALTSWADHRGSLPALS